MNDTPDVASGLADLIRSLTRLDAAPFGDPAGWPVDREPLADLVRLRVAADLLAELGRETPDLGYRRLSRALIALLDRWQDDPAAYDDALTTPCEHLADWLNDFFTCLDEGRQPADLAHDRRWSLVADSLATAGTPLAVFAESAWLFDAWQRAWGDEDLPAAAQTRIYQRWRSLRRQGDALYAAHWRGRFPPS